MFSDLVGSTALSARMDPEDLREVITAYQKCVAETVQASAVKSHPNPTPFRLQEAQPQRKSLLTRAPTMTFRPGASAQRAQSGGRAARGALRRSAALTHQRRSCRGCGVL
jgi:hypothetical protein